METTSRTEEVLIPDEVLVAWSRSQRATGSSQLHVEAPTSLTGRQRLAARVLLVLFAITALAVAAVVAIGAVIVAATLLVIGLVVRLAQSVGGSTRTPPA